MATRSLAAVIGTIVWCLAVPAHADPTADVAAKSRAAMASSDSMDYEVARKLLYQALAIAKKARLDRDPIVARVYLDLGIAQLAGSDQEGAKVALLSAAQIDPKITIDPAYRSPELVRLLDEAKAAAAAIDGGAGAAEPAADGVDCKALRGVQHTVIDGGKRNAPQVIEAWVGGDLTPARVAVMYRPEGAVDFIEAKAAKAGGCKYVGTIPASATRGSVVHYYIAAYDVNNRVLASKGSSGAPNVVEIGERPRVAEAPPPGSPATDPEIPQKPEQRDTVSGGVIAGGKPPRLLLAVSGGTGFGYVTGKTEGDNQVQTCCIGSSLVVVTPELGYYASLRTSLGLAVRLGFPIGANIAGHSTLAPAGFLRIRHGFSDSGDGLHVMGELGGGILRNTIKLNASSTVNTGPGMDTDVVAQGPLLVGAGIGYTRHITGAVAFVVDLDAMAGIAVVDKVGSAVHLNTGVSADMSLGFAIGF